MADASPPTDNSPALDEVQESTDAIIKAEKASVLDETSEKDKTPTNPKVPNPAPSPKGQVVDTDPKSTGKTPEATADKKEQPEPKPKPTSGAKTTGAGSATGVYPTKEDLQPKEENTPEFGPEVDASRRKKVNTGGADYYLEGESYKEKGDSSEEVVDDVEKDPEYKTESTSTWDKVKTAGVTLAETFANSNLDTNLARALGSLRSQVHELLNGDLLGAAGTAVDASFNSLRILGDGVGSFKDAVKRRYGIDPDQKVIEGLGNLKEAMMTKDLHFTSTALTEGLQKMKDACEYSYGLKQNFNAYSRDEFNKLVPKEERSAISSKIDAKMYQYNPTMGVYEKVDLLTPEDKAALLTCMYKGVYDDTSTQALAKYALAGDTGQRIDTHYRDKILNDPQLTAHYAALGANELTKFVPNPADATQRYYNSVVQLRDEAERKLQALTDGYEYEYDDDGNIARDSSGRAITHPVDKKTAQRRRALKAQLDLYNQAIGGMDEVLKDQKGMWSREGDMITPSKRELSRREKQSRLMEHQREPVGGAMRTLNHNNPEIPIETYDLGQGIEVPKDTADGHGRSQRDKLESAMDRIAEDHPGYTEMDLSMDPAWVTNHNALACMDIHECAQMKRSAVCNSPDYADLYAEIDEWEKEECSKYHWRGEGVQYHPYARDSLREWMEAHGIEGAKDYADTYTVANLFPGARGIEGSVGKDNHGNPIFSGRRRDSNLADSSSAKNRMGGLYARYVDLISKYDSGTPMSQSERVELTRLEKIKRRQELDLAINNIAGKVVSGDLKDSAGNRINNDTKEYIKSCIVEDLYSKCSKDLGRLDWDALDTSSGSNMDNPKIDGGMVDTLINELPKIRAKDNPYDILLKAGLINEVDLKQKYKGGLRMPQDEIMFNARLPSKIDDYLLKVEHTSADQDRILSKILGNTKDAKEKRNRLNQFLHTGNFEIAYSPLLKKGLGPEVTSEFISVACDDLKDLTALGYISPDGSLVKCQNKIMDILTARTSKEGMWSFAAGCDLVYPVQEGKPPVTVKDVFNKSVEASYKHIQSISGGVKAEQALAHIWWRDKYAKKALNKYISAVTTPPKVQEEKSDKVKTPAKKTANPDKKFGFELYCQTYIDDVQKDGGTVGVLKCYTDPELRSILGDGSARGLGLPEAVRKGDTPRAGSIYVFCPKCSNTTYLEVMRNKCATLREEYAKADTPEEKERIKSQWAKLRAYAEVYNVTQVDNGLKRQNRWNINLRGANQYYDDLVAGYMAVTDLNPDVVIDDRQIISGACAKQGIIYDKTAFDWANTDALGTLKLYLYPENDQDVTQSTLGLTPFGADGVDDFLKIADESKGRHVPIAGHEEVVKQFKARVAAEDNAKGLVNKAVSNLMNVAWADCVLESGAFKDTFNQEITRRVLNKSDNNFFDPGTDVAEVISKYARETAGVQQLSSLISPEDVLKKFYSYLDSDNTGDVAEAIAPFTNSKNIVNEALTEGKTLNLACWEAVKNSLDAHWPDTNDTKLSDRVNVNRLIDTVETLNSTRGDKPILVESRSGSVGLPVRGEGGTITIDSDYGMTPTDKFRALQLDERGSGESAPEISQPASGNGEEEQKPSKAQSEEDIIEEGKKKIRSIFGGTGSIDKSAPIFGSKADDLKKVWVDNIWGLEGEARSKVLEDIRKVSPLFSLVMNEMIPAEDGAAIPNNGIPRVKDVRDFLKSQGVLGSGGDLGVFNIFNEKLSNDKTLLEVLNEGGNYDPNHRKTGDTASKIERATKDIRKSLLKIAGKLDPENKEKLADELFWTGIRIHNTPFRPGAGVKDPLMAPSQKGKAMCASLGKVPEDNILLGAFKCINPDEPRGESSYELDLEKSPDAGAFWISANKNREEARKVDPIVWSADPGRMEGAPKKVRDFILEQMMRKYKPEYEKMMNDPTSPEIGDPFVTLFNTTFWDRVGKDLSDELDKYTPEERDRLSNAFTQEMLNKNNGLSGPMLINALRDKKNPDWGSFTARWTDDRVAEGMNPHRPKDVAKPKSEDKPAEDKGKDKSAPKTTKKKTPRSTKGGKKDTKTEAKPEEKPPAKRTYSAKDFLAHRNKKS